MLVDAAARLRRAVPPAHRRRRAPSAHASSARSARHGLARPRRARRRAHARRAPGARTRRPTSSSSRRSPTRAATATACRTSCSRRWRAAGRSSRATSPRSRPRGRRRDRTARPARRRRRARGGARACSRRDRELRARLGRAGARPVEREFDLRALRATRLRRPAGGARMPEPDGRLRAEGLPADVGALHRERDPAPRAGRRRRCACYVIKPPRRGRSAHPVVDRIRAPPAYLPPTTSLSPTPLRRWLRENLPAFLPALGRVARRRPLGLARAAGGRARAVAARPQDALGAGRARCTLKELLLAVALADRLLDAPDVRHLHAHFAHGATTVAWLASMITGLPFSFTGHAKDIYSRALNPGGLLRAQAARGALRRHLHGGEPRRTCARIAPEADGAPRLPRAQRRLRAAARRERAGAPGAQRRRCASSPSAGSWRRRASTCSSRPARSLRRRAASPAEATIVGGRTASERRRAAPADRRARARRRVVRSPGRCRRRQLLRRVRARDGVLPALPRARRRRPRRHPERARRGDGVRPAGRDDGASPGSRSSSRTARTGCSCRRTTRRRVADALLRLHDDPSSARAARRRRRARPSRARSTASGSRARLAGAVPRRRRMSATVAAGRLRPRPVFCAIEHLHRDRGGRRRGPRGRFTHAGVTLELGREPDWLGAPLPDDEEWRIEWVKFYYGLDLAPRVPRDGRPRLPATRGSGSSARGSSRSRRDHDASEVDRAADPELALRVDAVRAAPPSPGSRRGSRRAGGEHRRRRPRTCART